MRRVHTTNCARKIIIISINLIKSMVDKKKRKKVLFIIIKISWKWRCIDAHARATIKRSSFIIRERTERNTHLIEDRASQTHATSRIYFIIHNTHIHTLVWLYGTLIRENMWTRARKIVCVSRWVVTAAPHRRQVFGARATKSFYSI